MKRSKIPPKALADRAIHSTYHNRFCRRILVASLASAYLLSTIFNLVERTEAQQKLGIWIRPIEAVIQYRETDRKRPENLPPKSGKDGYYKQQGILTALQGSANAKLQLWWDKQPYNPLIVVGPDKQQTTDYYFPCTLRQGTATVGWGVRKASSNGCKIFIVHLPKFSVKKNSALSPVQQQTQQSKQITGKNDQLTDNIDTLAQQIEISPTQDATLVLIQSMPNEVTVDVLEGEIKVDARVGQTATVKAGNHYTYSQSTGSSITPSSPNITQSPSVQEFLKPEGWSPEAQEILSAFQPPPPSDIAKELLTAHNQCRAKVGVPPLKWSTSLASFAQEWADQLSKTGKFEHRSGGGSGLGENLAAGSMTPTALVDMWCDEQSQYNPQTGQCVNGGMECYHFTQVVWRNTSEVGCGLASHPRYGKVLVCNYNPPGNFRGQRPF
jgi:hypothetical protein